MVYHAQKHTKIHTSTNWRQIIGVGLLGFALGGLIGPLSTSVRLESFYKFLEVKQEIKERIVPTEIPLPPAVPSTFDPLVGLDGSKIVPINTTFSIIIPKIGVNATIVADVDPLDETKYVEALKNGVAHSNLSYYPDENGTVYIFSHSTNYDWFVKDLNAVFYLLKNLTSGDHVVIIYHGKRYTYEITRSEIVEPDAINFLLPQSGDRNLILQTCWPPGTTKQRMLLFADLIDESNFQ